jgi:ribosomal protein S18 acetylase RimI-like enzyme
MTSDKGGIIQLNKSHAKDASLALVKAFWDHQPLQYYFPDEAERERIAPYFFSTFVFYGIQHGEVHTTSRDFEGVAVWLPSSKYPVTTWRLLRSVPLSEILGFGKNGGARMKKLGQYIDTVHDRMAPFDHWFLQCIGVDNKFQGRGYGSKLLRPMLKRIEEEGLPCYLETLEKQNVRLYEHFGFKVVEELDVPGTNLTMWAMLRGKSNPAAKRVML